MSTKVFERGTSQRQKWSTTLYESNARFVGDLAARAVELLDPRPGERILDIGCGDGYLTEKIAAAGAMMSGVDYSPELVAAAQARGLDVRVGNAEELDYFQEFDGAFSNAAMHWMRRADAVVRGVARALKPGGRFVGEFAGARNAYYIRQAVHEALTRRGFDAKEIDPWYLPEAGEYQEVLEGEGLIVSHIELFDRPVVIDYPVSDWIRTFGSPYLTVLDENECEPLLAEVTRQLAARLLGKDGRWTIDYTRLRFRAEKP
ncbi:class I SAM-dependent methyltransferase [Paraburkholderia sp. UCT2]|uniref:class I SAM-dependent methyltransferase n=1 Tax=Paraburkholderia sp. UCT2 TaxID=2615208 RepID=UPI0016566313|nr:class I SAM-dependent methyltransferase [Paraburkholderia sp. UCT2]MBC8727702.1 methyltransferase domain-containing protein [Paraburkholderia sp. UCT2]